MYVPQLSTGIGWISKSSVILTARSVTLTTGGPDLDCKNHRMPGFCHAVDKVNSLMWIFPALIGFACFLALFAIVSTVFVCWKLEHWPFHNRAAKNTADEEQANLPAETWTETVEGMELQSFPSESTASDAAQPRKSVDVQTHS